MKEEEILSNINKIILSENGLPVTMDNLFTQSTLDSLGKMIVFLTISGEYNLDTSKVDKLLEDILTLKVSDLVALCKSSITNT